MPRNDRSIHTIILYKRKKHYLQYLQCLLCPKLFDYLDYKKLGKDSMGSLGEGRGNMYKKEQIVCFIFSFFGEGRQRKHRDKK